MPAPSSNDGTQRIQRSAPQPTTSRYADVCFCTVVAQNYLPQALALAASLSRHHEEATLVLLILDGRPDVLEMLDQPNLVVVGPDFLGLAPREFLELAMTYDVVELATAIKPRFFRKLLEVNERVVYLDPDTYVVSRLDELPDLIDEHGCVLTPHFLEPIPPGTAYISEIHCLTVGVFNLGFAGFGRTSVDLLDWWWSHLQRECLKYPLLGLFVDQKWMDLAPSFFNVHALRHYGYNVGPWNMHERPVAMSDGLFTAGHSKQPLRLLHFSGFDPSDPDSVSERLNIDMTRLERSDVLRDISRDYARLVLAGRDGLPQDLAYRYATDTQGKAIPRRLRQAYREALLANRGEQLPLPFIDQEAVAFAQWWRSSLKSRQLIRTADAALSIKYAFPDVYDGFRRNYKATFRRLRARLLDANKVRR